MSRKTLLQCVNGVMKLLRRSTVSTANESIYSTLITSFVNQAIEDIEGEHLWSGIYREDTLTLSSGVETYSLTGWQDRGRIERVVNKTSSIYEIEPKSNDDWLRLDEAIANQKPSHFRLYSPDSSGDAQIQFYPTPDATYSVRVSGYVGQGEIATDSTLVLVPASPVILRAYAFAIRERGEDGGTSFAESIEIAEEAMQKAIDADQQSRVGGKVASWSVV